MRVSAKGRYGLAAMVYMAQLHHNGEYVTIISISEALGISKIYLEQIFSLLRRGEIVSSVKGAQGGYRLIKTPKQVTVYDVLLAIETSLFEKTDETVAEKMPALESAMQLAAFEPLSHAIETTLKKVTLHELVVESERQREDNNFMFYI